MDESKALARLFKQTGGLGWHVSTGWTKDAELGKWFGVTIRDGAVVALNLPSNFLEGEPLYSNSILSL